MLDYVARHPSVYALPDEFSSCFGSAECCWAAEPHGVEWNEPPLADCEYGRLVTDVMREMERLAGLKDASGILEQ